MNLISFYGSHNSSVAISIQNRFEVIELERFLSVKNCGLAQYLPIVDASHIIDSILYYIKQKYGVDNFDICFYANTEQIHNDILINYHHLIPAKKYIQFNHHESHAAGTFFQSQYDSATVVSFDGGGPDGFFNVYSADRSTGLTLLGKEHHDLGYAYMVFGHYLKDIKYEPLYIGNLTYAGKLMGLCSYGEVNSEWLPHFINYYYELDPNEHDKTIYVKKLGEKIGISFDENSRIEGQKAYDIAATSQKAFEEVAIALIKKYYSSGPLCLTGGCALNIIFNARIKNNITNEVFVAPNSNDCGLATGALLNYLKPEKAFDVTYAGLPILDVQDLYLYASGKNTCSIEQLASKLNNGLIVGCMNGQSEHGPRALGNRSILCNPTIKNMKNILNEKVKHREWFRPFAPVVRLEDVNKYFEFNDESRFMSFLVTVKDEWKQRLEAITHVDGSARVQTVTRQQNPWLYDLLTEMEKQNGVGMLLNTSFNVDGKPITTRISEAIEVLNTTRLDGLYILGYYIEE